MILTRKPIQQWEEPQSIRGLVQMLEFLQLKACISSQPPELPVAVRSIECGERIDFISAFSGLQNLRVKAIGYQFGRY
jgi:hypothetical protein